ncbi:MAG: BRO family protein [Bacteroidales bacterium]
MPTDIKLFENKKIRTQWDSKTEKWYFSIIDIIKVLTESPRPRKYWSALKLKLIEEGSQLSQNMGQLKLVAEDGKMRLTDVADTEQLFRLIQSIPSPKAEPMKQWIAQVAKERIEQMQDPELSINQAMLDYKRLGYSERWINQRLRAIEFRKELTDEWEKRGVKQGQQFAILTDVIYRAWAEMSTKEYKEHKGLKIENLRDNMTSTELALNILAEAATKDISEAKKPDTFTENISVAKQGGEVAFNARKEIEEKTGRKVISTLNATNTIKQIKK